MPDSKRFLPLLPGWPSGQCRYTTGGLSWSQRSAPNFGSKMGIDATRKWPEEGFARPWPDVIEMPAEVKRRVDQLWRQAGL